MRLKRLIVRNFQSHRKTELNLHPGINIIFGESNHGKTAIFRAFQWLAINRPLGFRFYSWFAWFAGKKEPTQVTVQTDRNTIIRTRYKGKKSTYDIDGHKFKGFDKDVPDEVVSALNMTELNVQPQLEPFFLVTSSPSEITKVINRVTKIEKTDEWLKKLTTRINTCRAEKRVLESELKVIKDDLDEIGDLSKAEAKVVKAEKKLKMFNWMRKEHHDLIMLTENYEEINIELRRINNLLKKKKQIDEASSTIKELSGIEREEKDLESFIKLSTEFDSKFVNLSDKISMCNKLHSILEEIADIEKRLRERGILRAKIEDKNSLIEEMKKSIKDLLLDFGQCPICYSDIESDDLDRIMERL